MADHARADGAPPCPGDDVLVALVERTLSPAAFDQLEDHIDGCDTCRRAVATLLAGRRAPSGVATLSDGAGDPASSGVAPTPGMTLAGRYVVDSMIGSGGMGTVFLAHDRALERTVALKVHRGARQPARLRQEATAMARLAHPNVVTVFEIGDTDGFRFVAMEYVPGGTLRDWLAAEPRTWRAILSLLLEVGRGIVAAHAAGIIHRDFKPENVLVGRDGRPRVSDFGLARAEDRAVSAPIAGGANATATVTPLTETGTTLGTPAYMAPEQVTGADVDARCDQFAFCVTAWEVLYGSRPFAGTTLAEIQIAIERGELAAVPASAIPIRVQRVLTRGLAWRAADRFAEMSQLLAALELAARPRSRRWVVAAAGVALALGGGTVWATRAVAQHRQAAACDGARDRVAALVGPDALAEIGRAGRSGQRDVTQTTAVLARVGGVLATATRTACLADEPEPVGSARRRCLDEHTAKLADLVDTLRHAGQLGTADTASAAWSLVELTPCTDDRALLAAPARDRLSAADQAALLAANTLRATGQYALAVSTATPVLVAAIVRGDREAQLAAALLIAECEPHLDDSDAATSLLRTTLTLAEQQGRDLEAARALDTLASILSDGDAAAQAEAHRDIALARAKLDRLGGVTPALEGTLLLTEARLDQLEFRNVESETALRRALALDEQAYGPDHPEVGKVLATLGQTLDYEGGARIPEAIAVTRRALAIFERSLGNDHPLTMGAAMSLAILLGSTDEARQLLERAESICVRVVGADTGAHVQILAARAELEVDRKQLAAGRKAFTDALAILDRTGQGATSVAGGLHRDLGGALALDHQYAAALAEEERSLAILEPKLGASSPELSATLEHLATDHLGLGHPAIALPLAERAFTTGTAGTGFDPSWAARCELVVADALWALGKHDDARTRAHHAATYGPDRPEVVAWLAAHSDR